MTGPGHSTREQRQARKTAVARALALGMVGGGESTSLAAAHAGISETRFRQYCDPESQTSIPFADVLMLPPTVRRTFASWLAETLGFELVGRHAPSGVVRVVSLAQHAGDALAKVAAALSDGHVTRAEADALEQSAVKLSAEAQAVIALARRARAEGAVRVSS